jgi:serine/threonine protein kinase
LVILDDTLVWRTILIPDSVTYCRYDPKDAVAFLEMPHFPRGDLRAHIKASSAHRSEAEVKHIFADLIRGLDYLHGNGVIHFDIKPDNILVGEDGNAKITDFDISKDAASRTLAVSAATTKAVGGLTLGHLNGFFSHISLDFPRFCAGALLDRAIAHCDGSSLSTAIWHRPSQVGDVKLCTI